jgi:hypothetical protein
MKGSEMSTSKNSAGLAGVATSTPAAPAPGLDAPCTRCGTQTPIDAPAERPALFERFDWFELPFGQATVDSALLTAFAGNVLDVTQGVEAVLQMTEQIASSEAHGDEDGQPLPRLLDAPTASSLRRLSIAALSLLAAKAERIGDDTVTRAYAKGGAA